jgi:DNA polymerase-3 subunit delta'
LDRLGSWVCDLLRLRADPRVAHLDNPDQREALATLAASLAPAAAHRYLQRVLRARSLSDATINKQMLYEALLVRWARLAKGDDRG